MKVILTFYSGEVREFELEKSQFIIGRSPKSDIPVSVEGISRSHCLIEVEEGGDIYVTDLASTNGVLIDNKKIQPEKRTLYNLFLNLSLGPIQSVQLDLGDATSHKINWSANRRITPNVEREVTSPAHNKTRVVSNTGKIVVNRAVKKNKSIDVTTLIKFLIPILIFLGFFYYDHLMKSEGSYQGSSGEEDTFFSQD